MRKINEDIKTGQLNNLYLLYGTEDYLKKQFKEKLAEAFLPGDRTMNLTVFEGKGAVVSEIIDQAETMPFFAERRLIIVEDSGLCSGSGAELADYLKSMPDTCAMVFVESEVDKRSKLFKFLTKEGYACEFGTQDEKTLSAWIAGRIKAEGKETSMAVIRALIEQCGTDMYALNGELEKLIAYTMGRTDITVDDVRAVCSTQINNRIFEMVDALGSRDRGKALALYYDLLSLKEAPMRILFLIARQFRIMMTVNEMRREGYSDKEIASAAGTPPWTVKKYAESARNMGAEAIRSAMDQCAQLEHSVKTGNISEQMSVELLLMRE